MTTVSNSTCNTDDLIVAREQLLHRDNGEHGW